MILSSPKIILVYNSVHYKVLTAVLAICRILLIVSVPRQKVKNPKSKI